MPNKTIYVSDDDLAMFARAQELSGGNLSATITAALRRYIEIEEGRREGYDEVTVKVGPGAGRKVRFTGVLLGEWGRSTSKTVETFRVFRSHKGKLVVHTERSAEHVWSGENARSEGGWRAVLQSYFTADQIWGSTQAEATLEVFDSPEQLSERIPAELYELIRPTLTQPAVEDLDI